MAACPSIYKAIVDLGCKRALILTDPGVRQAGLVQLVQDALVDFCVGVFDDIAQDTDLDTVDAAVAMARDLKADCIVSVGGGSVIDTAKAVCVTLKNGGKANDHIAMQRLQEPQTPHIVIPTTSGTGSEVTNVAVIKSKTAGRKVYIVDIHIVPNVGHSGSPLYHDPAPGIDGDHGHGRHDPCRRGPDQHHGPADLRRPGHAGHPSDRANTCPWSLLIRKMKQARNNLQIAATMAGWAFTIAQVGLAHAMAHTVGILHNVPHGAACGIVLPKVMRFNVDFAADKLAMVAQAMGVNTTGWMIGQRPWRRPTPSKP